MATEPRRTLLVLDDTFWHLSDRDASSRTILTVDEAAAALNVTREECCALIATGRLPAMRSCFSVFVPRWAVQRRLARDDSQGAEVANHVR